jgi:hypothetical protein
MSDDRNDRIGEFFRAQAPPVRDPAFRLRVLERREHRQFQRRLFSILAGALLIILISAFAVGFGQGSLATTGALSVGAAIASGYFAFRGRLLQILRRFSI